MGLAGISVHGRSLLLYPGAAGFDFAVPDSETRNEATDRHMEIVDTHLGT